MIDGAIGILFVMILTGAGAAGMWLQRRLRESHRSRETTDAIRTILGMVVTFSALVLGLLVTSVKVDFDDHTNLYRRYGISLIELDHRLREFGSQADWIRRLTRSYTASVLVGTWPAEPRPAGEYSVNLRPITPGSEETAELTAMMWKIDQAIQRLTAADPFQQQILSILRADIAQLSADRWTLVERSHSKISPLFIAMLMSWLAIVFFIFGIVSPANLLIHLSLFLSALAVASSLCLTLNLDSTVTGIIPVSSQPMRDALWHMDQPANFELCAECVARP